MEHEDDNSLPSSVEIKNVWSFTSTPPQVLLCDAEVHGQFHPSCRTKLGTHVPCSIRICVCFYINVLLKGVTTLMLGWGFTQHFSGETNRRKWLHTTALLQAWFEGVYYLVLWTSDLQTCIYLTVSLLMTSWRYDFLPPFMF